jgi:hypothetical protein
MMAALNPPHWSPVAITSVLAPCADRKTKGAQVEANTRRGARNHEVALSVRLQ